MDEEREVLQEDRIEDAEITKVYEKESEVSESSGEAEEMPAALSVEEEIDAAAVVEEEIDAAAVEEEVNETTVIIEEGEIEDDIVVIGDDEPGETEVVLSEEDMAAESETESEEAKETGDEQGEDEAEEETVEMSPEDLAMVEKIKQRRMEAAAKERRHQRRVFTVLTIIILLLIAMVLSFTPIFTVDSIEVSGNSHYTAEEIISMGHAVPGKNLIYHSDKSSIESYLEQNPYIKTANVKRKLPSTLVIEVEERTEMMALPYDDDYLILDEDGILLRKNRSQPKLTLIEGNVINKIKLGETLGTKDSSLMDKSTKIIQTMNDCDLYYVKVDMSDIAEVRAYVYDTLIVRMDYNSLIENMENGKLHRVLDELFSQNIKRGTITFDPDGTATFMPTF